MKVSSRLGASAIALISAIGAQPGQAQVVVAANTKPETVIVTGERTEADLPNKIENITAVEAQTQINAVNTEDMLKYMPSIVVRKRHYGDTQDPLATRTIGRRRLGPQPAVCGRHSDLLAHRQQQHQRQPAFRHRRAARTSRISK